MATTKKLTQKQVNTLLNAYIKEQTDAATAAQNAYNRQVDTELKAEEDEINTQKATANATANTAYDTQMVKTLVSKRRLAEGLARLGLSNSGAATAGRTATERAAQIAKRSIAQKRDATLATLNQKRETLQKKAEAKKQQNTASSQKALKNRIAEKRLSLTKQMY